MQVLRRWQVKQASYLLKCGINAMSSKQLVFSNTKNEFFSTLYGLCLGKKDLCYRY